MYCSMNKPYITFLFSLQFAVVEGLATSLMDAFPQYKLREHRSLFLLAICGSSFLVGLFMVTEVCTTKYFKSNLQFTKQSCYNLLNKLVNRWMYNMWLMFLVLLMLNVYTYNISAHDKRFKWLYLWFKVVSFKITSFLPYFLFRYLLHDYSHSGEVTP